MSVYGVRLRFKWRLVGQPAVTRADLGKEVLIQSDRRIWIANEPHVPANARGGSVAKAAEVGGAAAVAGAMSDSDSEDDVADQGEVMSVNWGSLWRDEYDGLCGRVTHVEVKRSKGRPPYVTLQDELGKEMTFHNPPMADLPGSLLGIEPTAHAGGGGGNPMGSPGKGGVSARKDTSGRSPTSRTRWSTPKDVVLRKAGTSPGGVRGGSRGGGGGGGGGGGDSLSSTAAPPLDEGLADLDEEMAGDGPRRSYRLNCCPGFDWLSGKFQLRPVQFEASLETTATPAATAYNRRGRLRRFFLAPLYSTASDIDLGLGREASRLSSVQYYSGDTEGLATSIGTEEGTVAQMLYEIASRVEAQAFDEAREEARLSDEEARKPILSTHFKLSSVGLSVVAKLRDLLRVSIRDVRLQRRSLVGSDAPGYQMLISIGDVCIGNQTLHASLPIVLARQPRRTLRQRVSNRLGLGQRPFLMLEVEQKTDHEDLLRFRKFKFHLVPLLFQVEDQFLWRLADMVDGIRECLEADAAEHAEAEARQLAAADQQQGGGSSGRRQHTGLARANRARGRSGEGGGGVKGGGGGGARDGRRRLSAVQVATARQAAAARAAAVVEDVDLPWPMPKLGASKKVLVDDLSISAVSLKMSLRVVAPYDLLRLFNIHNGAFGALLTLFGNLNHLPLSLTAWRVAPPDALHHTSWADFQFRATTRYLNPLATLRHILSLLLSLDIFGGLLHVCLEIFDSINSVVLKPLRALKRQLTAAGHTAAGRAIDRWDAMRGKDAGVAKKPNDSLPWTVLKAIFHFVIDVLRDVTFTSLYIVSLFACNWLSTLSRLFTIFVWHLDPEFVRNHAIMVYGQRQVHTLGEGVRSGVKACVTTASHGISDLLIHPIISRRYGWEEWGGWTGAVAGLLVGCAAGVYLCLAKLATGVADLWLKLFEALKSISSPRGALTTEAELPLVIDSDGTVRSYNEGEARACYLLSSLAQIDLEFYQAHHVIDIDGRSFTKRSAATFGEAPARNEISRAQHAQAALAFEGRREGRRAPTPHILLITTKRVVFGTFKPLHVVFEMPVERMARVQFPSPYNRLIIWSWHRLPIYLSPVSAARSNARPNGIHERELRGSNPQQLRAAFLDLQALAQQREREDAMLMLNSAAGADPRAGRGQAQQAHPTGHGIQWVDHSSVRPAVGLDLARAASGAFADVESGAGRSRAGGHGGFC